MTTPQLTKPKFVFVHNQFNLGPSAWKFIGVGTVMAILIAICTAICAPYLYIFTTSFKSADQFTEAQSPMWPSDVATFGYDQSLPVYTVPQDDGSTKSLALQASLDGDYTFIDPKNPTGDSIDWQGDLTTLTKTGTYTYHRDLTLYTVPMPDGQNRSLAMLDSSRDSVTFIDPLNPTAEPIIWAGRIGALHKVFTPSWHPENYVTAVQTINFLRLLLNTSIVAIVGALGATMAAALVAYGFTRFRIPFGEVLFLLLMSTIILPPQVTVIPTFIIFQRIGWIGTLWPLIIPHFFGNAYNIFLLRQYFMGMPYELDEAAKVDGASPWQVFTLIILPNARLALASVFLLHFLFAWNDFYNPLIYLSGSPDNYVISLGLQRFIQLHGGQPNLLTGASLLAMIVPLVLFFLAQKTFMQGIVLTGVEK